MSDAKICRDAADAIDREAEIIAHSYRTSEGKWPGYVEQRAIHARYLKLATELRRIAKERCNGR